MIISLLLSLATPAFAQSVPAACIGKSGAALQLCTQQAQIDAVKAQLAELKAECDAGCGDAPAPAPRAPSGPTPTPRLDALEEAVEELERKLAGGTVSDEEFRIEIERIEGLISGIRTTLADHERRLRVLETRPAYVPGPPPPAVEPIPGPRGEAGRDGRDGIDGVDGRPAEITLLVGVNSACSPDTGWGVTSGRVEIEVGGRPLYRLHLGGYGAGFMASPDDLGYAAGGTMGIDAFSWFRPTVKAGWREFGIGLTQEGATQAIQGIELLGGPRFVYRGLTADISGGAWFTGEEGVLMTWDATIGWSF